MRHKAVHFVEHPIHALAAEPVHPGDVDYVHWGEVRLAKRNLGRLKIDDGFDQVVVCRLIDIRFLILKKFDNLISD